MERGQGRGHKAEAAIRPWPCAAWRPWSRRASRPQGPGIRRRNRVRWDLLETLDAWCRALMSYESAWPGGAGFGGMQNAHDTGTLRLFHFSTASPVWLLPVDAYLVSNCLHRNSLLLCLRRDPVSQPPDCRITSPTDSCADATLQRHPAEVTTPQYPAGAVADLYVLRGLAAQSPGGDAKAPQPVWTPLEASGTPPTPRKGHAVAGSMFCEAPGMWDATTDTVRDGRCGVSGVSDHLVPCCVATCDPGARRRASQRRSGLTATRLA